MKAVGSDAHGRCELRPRLAAAAGRPVGAAASLDDFMHPWRHACEHGYDPHQRPGVLPRRLGRHGHPGPAAEPGRTARQRAGGAVRPRPADRSRPPPHRRDHPRRRRPDRRLGVRVPPAVQRPVGLRRLRDPAVAADARVQGQVRAHSRKSRFARSLPLTIGYRRSATTSILPTMFGVSSGRSLRSTGG